MSASAVQKLPVAEFGNPSSSASSSDDEFLILMLSHAKKTAGTSSKGSSGIKRQLGNCRVLEPTKRRISRGSAGAQDKGAGPGYPSRVSNQHDEQFETSLASSKVSPGGIA